MSMQAEDGRQVVARGRIRVDARRALAKLREHLLVDLHLYATEIARAAVASKATFVDVEYDADDVVMTFDGEPFAPNDLPRLLDHVLGDGQSTDRALRGLALGVNAALGLGPAFVDIYVRQSAEYRTLKVRFVPSVLESEGSDLPEVELVHAPKGMPTKGMRVHLRRRMGVNLLKRAATREVPREIELLVAALQDAPVELRSPNAALPTPSRRPALLRVAFKERDLRRGTVELVEHPAKPMVEYLELGVLLVQKSFVTEPILPAGAHAQVELPVRVMIDADELPTNASRSALREDSPLPIRAEQGAREALILALQSLVTLVTGQGKPLPGVEIVHGDPRKLEDALGAIVCVVAGAYRRGAALSEGARALLDVPLLYNAVGNKISPRRILDGVKGDVFVYSGKEPVDKQFEPWLDDVVWVRGRVIERILVDMGVQDAKARIAAAQVGHERRRVLHARPPSDPVVPDDDGHVVKETFQVADGFFKGLRGQLALGAEGQRTGQRPSSVRIYVEGRHIDTLTIDRDKLPLSMDAAIAWDGRLLPKFSYEGVRDDEALRLSIFQLTRLSLVALGAYFDRSLQEKRAPEERARAFPLVRAAVGAFTMAAKALDVEKEVPAEPELSAYAGIWTRGVWPSADSDRLPISLAELKAYSDRTKAICYGAPGSNGVAPDGRPVVVVANLERQWLERVFPGVTFVPYERAIRPKGTLAAPNFAMFDSLRAARANKNGSFEMLPSMTFEMREGRGVMAPSVEDQCLLLHAGVLLSTAETNKFVEPALVVLEHDAVVPNPTWDGVLWSRELTTLTVIRNDMLERIVRAMEGDGEVQGLLRNFPVEAGPVLRSYLIEAVPRFRTQELGPRIEKLKLVFVLDADARPRLSSLAEIAARFPEPQTIPYVRAVPPFPTLDWQPLLLAHDREVAALLRWGGGRVKSAEDQLEARSKVAQVELQRRAFLQKPKVRLIEPSSVADPDVPAKIWQEQPKESGARVASVVAALPRKGLDLPLAIAEILYEERLICSRPLVGLPVPVVARVHLASDEHVVSYSDVMPAGIAFVESLVYSAACALAADLVARAERQTDGVFFEDRRGLALVRALYACSVKNPSRSDILVADFAMRAPSFKWPTVQGDHRSYSQLVPGGGKLYYATVRYDAWETASRGASDLDDPIVYLPATTEGGLTREILGLMGHEMIDVSSAVFALQSRRKPGAGHGGPTLSGFPEHSALRVTLSSLGGDAYEGEIELVEGTNTTVHVETLHGTNEKLEVTAPIAFRAVVRVEDVELDGADRKKIAENLSKAAVKHIESLMPRLDDLPYFVREGLRNVVLKYARKGKDLAKRRRQAMVFQDILGAYHSIEGLVEGGGVVPFVTMPPPYPAAGRPRPPLRLSADEANALARHVSLEDVTESIKREVAAHERKNAAPLSFIGLATTQRMESMDIVRYAGAAGADGEIGILAPEHAESRGIWVHKNRRPLCRLSDEPGWPIFAVINDDWVPVNKAFDGIKGNAARDELRRTIRRQAEEAIAKCFVLPSNALVGKTVETTLLDDAVFVTGALWLPASWMTAGSVEVRDGSNRFPTHRSFGASDGDGVDLSIPIPVGGRLFIANVGADKKASDVALAASGWILREATSLVEAAEHASADPRIIEGYRWLLRFLGADVGKLEAVSADGRRIDAAEIEEALKSKKEIWVTRGEGDVDGQFPAGMPSFILRDGQALVDVLRARTTLVREFAAVQEAPKVVEPQAVVDVAAFHFDNQGASTQNEQRVVVAPEIDVPLVEDAPEAGASWLRSLVQRVVVFFDRPAAMEPWTKELGPSLMLAIDKLGLTQTSVVTGVRYVRKGRPMVFDAASGELVINRSHHAVRSLADRVSRDSRARLLLVIAAVREINRVLEVVTDASERRVLLSLLRGEGV